MSKERNSQSVINLVTDLFVDKKKIILVIFGTVN